MHRIDARGLKCPEPVMLLHNRITRLGGGERIELLATDAGSARDIERFCGFLGHVLVHSEQDAEGVYLFVIEKRGRGTLGY
ncbi:MAG: sulfurtransferase TusA family protein [Gammaproteobacteria bacterium AqS3]|nr:sulfurtransferase TusA family protein [Gammaproteobacteria bacterium AqS3]